MDLVNTQTQSTTQLFAGDFPRVSKAITILTGLVLVIGTLLGKILLGAATSAAKTGGNTGNGTLVLDATTPILAGAKAGVYQVRILRAALAEVGTTPVVPAMKALASLKDPDGNVLAVVDVPTSSGVTISNQIKFVLTEGSTPFAVGDGFDITIAAGSGKYKAYDADNVDGSQYPELVLAEAIDSTAGDQKAVAYASGHFNEAAVTGVDANAKALLVGKPIFFGSVV